MTVLTYIYPRDVSALGIERLLREVRKQIPHVAIAELELKKRGTPDWEAVVFCHPSEPDVEMLFVVARNTKAGIADRVQRYGEIPAFSVVRSARIMIWAQLKSPYVPLKRSHKTWVTFCEVLATIAGVSDAVIDSPECERLFTASTFRRYHRMHQRRFERLGTPRS